VQRNQGAPQLGLELALLACIEQHRRAQSGLSTHPAPAQPATRPIASQPARSADPPDRPREEPVAPPRNEASSPAPVRPAMEPASALAQPASNLPSREEEAPEVTVSDSIAGYGLTINHVKEHWDQVKRRIRTRKDGGKIAAFLNGYTIIGVEDSMPPVVILQAQADFHYKALQQRAENIAAVEWGLKVALELEDCRVRLLPPGAEPPGLPATPRPPSPPSGPSLSLRGAPSAPQRSAYREQPSLGRTTRAQPQNQAAQAVQRRVPSVPVQPDDLDDIPPPTDDDAPGDVDFSPPLARIGTVRENTTVPPRTSVSQELSETRLESARTKAAADPVVQKALETFKAQIKEVKLK
ncbi:MAG: hypothetical protein J2P37_08790, partial [Ktedonobacteraceae bacterium]|nr:hypothetical protein [Ktedonobacteraceae bacterium]